jgi:hypothetical protein
MFILRILVQKDQIISLFTNGVFFYISTPLYLSFKSHSGKSSLVMYDIPFIYPIPFFALISGIPL